MLVTAVTFADFVLALHILAVVVAFGVTFAYPIFALVGGRRDPRAMPWFHRMQVAVGRRLVNPGLAIVLIAGIYLASHLDEWKAFYVQWGLAAVVVLGALEGAVMIRGETRLAEIADRDVAAAGTGAVKWSAEYEALFRRLGMFGALMQLIVVLTVFFMAAHIGA
jgi:Predicted integral membrane protein (DUF2269)